VNLEGKVEIQTLQALNEISTRLVFTPGKHGDLNSLLQHIAETAQEGFAADACVMLAFNPITEGFIGSQIVVGNLHIMDELLHDKPRPKGVTQQVLKEDIVLVEDLEEKPEYHNRFLMKEGIRSFAGLAMRTRHRHRPLGVIYLDFRQPREFTPTDRESFKNFAIQAALLLQEVWLENHLEEIARIGQEINHNLDTVEGLFQHLQTYVKAILDDSHMLLLAVYQPQTNTVDFHVKAQGTYTSMNSPLLLGGATKYIIESQEPQFIRHLSEEKDHLPFQVNNITGTEERESLIFVPLTLRGLSLGVLSIQHPRPNAYGQEDLFSLQLLANYFALALHNMRLYHNLNQLNETGQLLTQQLETEQTLQATVDKIRDATQADIVVLYPYEPALQRFVLPPRISGDLLNTGFPRTLRLRPDDAATLALSHLEPIFAKESMTVYTELYSDIQTRRGNFKEREKICSSAVVPLRVGNESVGVLFVNFRQPQRFDSTQKLLIEGLAHYAAIAIKNSQVFGNLSLRRVGELEILQKIDRELTHTLELDTVLNTILKLAHERIPADEASILLHNTRTHILDTAVAIGRHAEASRKQVLSLQEMKGITRWVVDQKKSARVNNVHTEEPWHVLYLPVASDIVSELDVPLLDGDEVVGVLNFESTKEGAFKQEEQDFLQTLAGQTVLAIKNAQAYEREKRLAEEGRVLNEISKEITSQLDLNHVFDLILKKALGLTNSTRGNLMLYDRERNDLWMAAERGVVEEKKGWRQSLDEGIVGNVAEQKQILNVDLSQPPWNDVNLGFFPGALSELAVPMLAGGDLLGVLNIESLAPNNFSERDERLLQGLADLAVIALQNAQAFEREKRLAAESQVLNQISKEITSQLDTSHVFDLILKKALELTYSTLGSLHLYNTDLNELLMVAEVGVAQGLRGLRQLLYEGIVGHVASQKQLLNVKDISQPPWNKIFMEFFPGTKSELAVPMLAGKEIRGVLNVESPWPGHFSEKDERLLQGLADLAVVALQNAERYKQAQVEAQRFKLLYQAGQELGKITDLAQLEQAYDIVLRIAEEQSQSPVVIRRFDIDVLELDVVRASQPHRVDLHRKSKLDSGINGQVAREKRTITLRDIKNPPEGIATPQPLNANTRSLLITPIIFEKQYYGNLGLDHEEVGHFQDADTLFFEGLAQQLAITIHRLETAKARQEFEQRAQSAELMSSIGQSAFEVTHRLGNDLGLVDSYITDIRSELEKHGLASSFISRKLENIIHSVQTVLAFSIDLRQKLAKLRDKEAMAGEPVLKSPRVLLEEVSEIIMVPANIQIRMEIDEDVAEVRVIYSLVADILRNLVINAIQAMPDGGTITLRGRNAGRYVAFEVTDTGVGIPQHKLPNIFDLFFSTKGSSGFGLWSARSNALKNLGDLKVESRPNNGTTFTLFLPRTDIDIV
jgi:GAF domain-containing protein